MSDTDSDGEIEGPAGPPRGADSRGRGRRFGFAVLALVVLVDAAALAAVAVGAFRRHEQIVGFQSPPSSPGPTGPVFAGAPSASPASTRPCQQPILIGTVKVDQVEARTAPASNAAVVATFGRTNVLDSPQVFDLVQRVQTLDGSFWYRVLLPIRPNGTTGYIPATSVRVRYTSYHLVVDRRKFTLTLFDGCDRMQTFPVGIGTGSTPTPVGRFYLTGLFKPPDPTTIYGVSIYTLSGFSEVLTHWELGGIIGLHGTNDPSSIGRNSSHGCIRMLNADILKLETILPLGTPIVIR